MIDLAIIGGGPAGITAGIYAIRKEMKVRVFEKRIAGGNTADATLIDNYPGLYNLTGLDIADKMNDHAKKLGVNVEEGKEVTEAKQIDGGFELKVMSSKEEIVQAKTILLVGGSTHKLLGVPGEKELYGKGVSYCATCDGPIFKGKKLVVVGGGDSGVTNALFLADLAEKVTLLEYNTELKAEEIYHKQLEENKVEVLLNKKTTQIIGQSIVEGVEYEDRKTGEKKTIDAAGVFVYVGLQPHNEIAKQLNVELSDYGFVNIDRETFMTNIPGVFSAGDLAGSFAQTIVACGEGAWAAVSAYNFIKGRKGV